MKNWLLYISIVLAVIMQISFLPNFAIYHVFPNLVLIFILVFLIRGQDDIVLWWVIFGGLLLDLFSPLFFGYYFIQLILIFLIYRSIVRPLLLEPSYPIVIALFSVFTVVEAGIEGFFTRQTPFPGLLPIVIYQSIIGFFFYFLISKILTNKRRIKT